MNLNISPETKAKLLKIAKGTGYAAVGAACTYLLQLLPGVNFGQYTPLIVALISSALHAGVKLSQSPQ